MLKRLFSLLLAVILCVGMLPVAAMAEETVPTEAAETEAEILDVTQPEVQEPAAPAETEAIQEIEEIPPETESAPEIEAPVEETEAPAETSNDGIAAAAVEDQPAVISSSLPASGKAGDNLTWTVDENRHLTISGHGEMYDYDRRTNEMWRASDYYPESVTINPGVTSIGFACFAGMSCDITLPATVVTIGESAFQNCKFTSFTIPSSVTTIEPSAFYECKNLTSITIPNSVTTLGSAAFRNCTSLEKIILSDNMTVVTWGLLRGCTSLTNVKLPDSLITIEKYAFEGCKSLKNISLPDALTEIKDYAFNNCTSLASIVIPDGVDHIQPQTFRNCTSLVTVTLPDTLLYINEYAFCNCTSLLNINIPKNLQSIYNNAFYGVPGLTKITLPATLNHLEAAFYGSCFEEIHFLGSAPDFMIGNIFGNITATVYYPADDPSWDEYVGKQYGGTVTWVGVSVPLTPSDPNKIVNVVSGVHVYWPAVNKAAKYGLWRSETGKDGTYNWLANPTVPHFTDAKVESGKTYYYKVTAMNGAGEHSEKSNPIGITYVSTPDISSRVNQAAGIKLGWKSVQGATGYAIYRKSFDGTDAWVRVATIAGNSTFEWVDTEVKNHNGTIYRYTIRALAGSNMKTLSGCRNTGRTMVRLCSRTLTSAAPGGTASIKCSWTTSSAVTGYEMRFMEGSTVFKTYTIGNYRTGTKTFFGPVYGHTYKVQVRSYKKVDGVGTFYSAWSAPKNVTVQ